MVTINTINRISGKLEPRGYVSRVKITGVRRRDCDHNLVGQYVYVTGNAYDGFYFVVNDGLGVRHCLSHYNHANFERV